MISAEQVYFAIWFIAIFGYGWLFLGLLYFYLLDRKQGGELFNWKNFKKYFKKGLGW